jgi:DNA-binding LytR/AlgR family response regulator
MFHIAVCDDCEIQTMGILSLLDKYRAENADIELHYQSFNSGIELLKHLKAGNRFDLFLLDILMPELNGINLAKEIRKCDSDASLIFLTSTKEYALEAFGVSATQYIVKPVKESALFPVLHKVIKSFKKEHEQFFMFSLSDKTVRLSFSSIICVEHSNRRLRVYLESKEILVGKCLRRPFGDVVAPLLRDKRFLRVHESFVINLTHAEEIRRSSFVMKNGITIPISRNTYTEAKNRYSSMQ